MKKINRIKDILITSFIIAVFLFSGCISESQSNAQTNKPIPEKQIDYSSVYKELISQRNRSIQLLKNAIESQI